MKVLIVEDEHKLAEALKRGLASKGHTGDIVEDGEKALERIVLYHEDYDVVVLDLMLPSLDGLSICRRVREQNIHIPILILTARGETETKVELLHAGADDYLAKPFSFEELDARINALLRRPHESMPTTLKVQDIELDPQRHIVTKDQKPVNLTLKEFALLEYFMRNPNRVINREELLNHVWDFNYTSFFSNPLDVHIKNLRKKIDHAQGPSIFETVRGVGYKLRQ